VDATVLTAQVEEEAGSYSYFKYLFSSIESQKILLLKNIWQTIKIFWL
jgi:hypothetical protein